jgi:SAM-dependent methyltransferase
MTVSDSYHRDHWVDVSQSRQDAYEEMFRWRPEMEPLLAPAAIAAGERVLDYGCGPGQLTVEVARRVAPGGHVHALDINADFVARTAARAAGEGVGPQITASRFDGAMLPFDDASLDLALSKSVLEYVDDPAAVLAEFHRVLKPGGRAHVIDSDWLMMALEPVGAERLQRLFEAARFAWRTPDIGRRLPGLFLAAGFRDVKVSVLASPDRSGRRLPIAINMTDYAREFGRMPAAQIDAIVAETEAAVASGDYLLILPQFVVTGWR